MSQIFQKLAPGQPAFTTESQQGEWARQFAFGALEPTAVVFHGTFAQLANSYARPSDANLANYNINGVTCYFCDDTDFRDRGAAFQEWIREISSLPQNFNDYESFAYQFPGYYLGRAPITKAPTSKLVKEFFLIGNTAQGANYATAAAIPQYYAQNYAWAYAFNTVNGIPADLVTLEGYLANTNGNIFLFASTPSLGTYQGWVTTDNANVQSFTIEAADSVLEHLRGPIWMRTRRFVKAQ